MCVFDIVASTLYAFQINFLTRTSVVEMKQAYECAEPKIEGFCQHLQCDECRFAEDTLFYCTIQWCMP